MLEKRCVLELEIADSNAMLVRILKPQVVRFCVNR